MFTSSNDAFDKPHTVEDLDCEGGTVNGQPCARWKKVNYSLMVEGTGLLDILTIDGIDFRHTKTNHMATPLTCRECMEHWLL